MIYAEKLEKKRIFSILYKKERGKIFMDNLIYCSNEAIYEKEMDLSAEEIEEYATCSSRTQLCLTDCAWPFPGAYISSND